MNQHINPDNLEIQSHIENLQNMDKAELDGILRSILPQVMGPDF